MEIKNKMDQEKDINETKEKAKLILKILESNQKTLASLSFDVGELRKEIIKQNIDSGELRKRFYELRTKFTNLEEKLDDLFKK
jgi:uncharacterized coiled-coil DUF342 family protein